MLLCKPVQVSNRTISTIGNLGPGTTRSWLSLKSAPANFSSWGSIFLPHTTSATMSSASANISSTTPTTIPTYMVSTSTPVSSSTPLPAFTGQGPATSVTTSISSITYSATSTTSSSSLVSKQTTSASPSHSSRELQHSTSTTRFRSSNSPSPTSSSRPSSTALPNHRLSNSTVAGIVVGAALSLALLTFLATFAIMRRQRQSQNERRPRFLEYKRRVALNPPQHQGSTGASRTRDSYLPQSADDRTIQQKVRSTFDQLELHVENFYRNPSSSALRPDNEELAVFDSPYLSASLASLLPHSRNRLGIIKHALVQFVTSSLSPTADSARSLMPTEYTLLPSTITSTKSSVTLKPSKYLLPHMCCAYAVANATKTSPK